MARLDAVVNALNEMAAAMIRSSAELHRRFIMDKANLQQIAEIRVRDAEVLLAAGQWDAAYYLLGYSIECALKACISKQFRQHEVPDKKPVNDFYTHKLDDLLNLSGVKSEMDANLRSKSLLGINWITVRDWNESTRYEVGTTEDIARSMYDAVTDTASGILPRLKTQW